MVEWAVVEPQRAELLPLRCVVDCLLLELHEQHLAAWDAPHVEDLEPVVHEDLERLWDLRVLQHAQLPRWSVD